jgi:hypothetical protein
MRVAARHETQRTGSKKPINSRPGKKILSAAFFGLRRLFGLGLGVPDGLGQHLA